MTGRCTRRAAWKDGSGTPSDESPSRLSWSDCSATTSKSSAQQGGPAVPHPVRRCVSAVHAVACPRQGTQEGFTQIKSPLVRKPYDFRHAGVSLRFNANTPATQVAEWAGHSVEILHRVYAQCLDAHDERWFDQIDAALLGELDSPGCRAGPSYSRPDLRRFLRPGPRMFRERRRSAASGGIRLHMYETPAINVSAGQPGFLLDQLGRPLQDSNLRTRLRRPVLYPLS
jgi:hypothetical protein